MERSDFEVGFLVGLLVGEGHFGGDGRAPQVVVKMHVDHEATLRYVQSRFGGTLYGPYEHGGRHYYQWMLRAAPLRAIMPLLIERITPDLSERVHRRFMAMREKYARVLSL